MLQEYYQKISKTKKFIVKLAILYGVAITTIYLIFRAYYINFSGFLAPFSIILYLAELHTLILLYALFYSIWPRKYKTYNDDNLNKNLQINIFVLSAGEPIEVVKETLINAKKTAVYYYNKVKPFKTPRVILLNDAKGRGKENWTQYRDVCGELGIEHVARDTNDGFKAGNINNGLNRYPSYDSYNTIDVFFDADFCAKEEFLTEILKPLKEDSVDFVQSPQRYKNLNTWVAKAAGAHQIFFFDYICPAKAHDNALFLCGTNYAIRRSALLAAGGVENRFVTEDYATSIKLHLLGKKGVFVSKVLAEGLAPMNLKEYFNQQTRWCKGCLDANGAYIKELLFGPLNLRQKFHYFFSTTYYFIGIRDAILILAPIPYLFFGVSLIRANTISYLAFIYLPLVIYNFILFAITFKNPVKSLVLDVVSFPVFAKAFISSVLRVNLPFSITVKKYEKENPFVIYRGQLLMALVLMGGLIYSLFLKKSYNPYGAFINHFWAGYDTLFLTIGFILVVRENYNLSKFEYFTKRTLNALANTLISTRRYALKPASILLILTIVGSYLGYGYMSGVIAYEKYQKTAEYKFNDVINYGKTPELLVPLDGVYYGYYHPELDVHPDNIKLGMVEGDNPSLIMYYQDWNENSKFNTRLMNEIYAGGAIPVVTWEPWDTQNLDNALINHNKYSAKAILSGYYDDHIRSWAKGAKKFGKPFYLRFAHEMNGNWYPWGNHDDNSADEYKAMWIYVHNIFEEEGAENVLWLWSPNNTDQFGDSVEVLKFYPGSEYVDWVGFSAFNWGTTNENTIWKDFANISMGIYMELGKLGKPIMVSETSSVSHGGNKTLWFRDTFHKDIPSMPDIKAVVIFNQNFGRADFNLGNGINTESVINENFIDNDYYLKSPIIKY